MKTILLIATCLLAVTAAQAQTRTTTTTSGTLAPQPTAQPVAPPPPANTQIAPGQPAPIQPSTQTNAQMLQQRANSPQGVQTTTQPNLEQKYQVDPNSTGTPTNTNSPVINNTRPTNNTQTQPVRVGNLQGTSTIQTGSDGRLNGSSTTIQLGK